jgi:putative peptide zinc metalloprotease protein
VAAFVLVMAAFLVPLPHRVYCTLYVKPREAASVYVESAGAIRDIHVRPGDWVHSGQPILTLTNIEIQLAIERLTGERERLESRLRSLRQRAFDDEGAAMEITEVEKALSSVLEQLAARQRDVRKLVVAAPVSGVVIAIPARQPQNQDSGRLRSWSGTVFDEFNLTAFLTSASPVCDIGDPNRLEAILAIGEQDVEFLRTGQVVDIFLDQLPGQPFTSRIEQLSQVDMKITPRSLSSKEGGDLVSRTDSLGRERPLNTTYQANAQLDDHDGILLVGATGQAKIYTQPQTLAQRFWRYVRQTFTVS